MYQKVKYKLTNNDNNSFVWLSSDEPEFPNDVFPAPNNWDDSEKTLKRSTKTFGVYTELSKNLEFTKGGRNFLINAIKFKDIEADVALEEFRKNPITEAWYLHSTGVFDFSEYDYDDIFFKVPFKTGGLNAKIESQLKEEFEVERSDSIDGSQIEPINLVDVALTSRKILLISQLETEEKDRVADQFRMRFNTGFRTGSLPVPLTIVSNSDEDLQATFLFGSFTTTPNNGTVSSMFYLDNDLNKQLQLRIKLKCKVKLKDVTDLSDEFFRIDLVKFENGNNLDIVEFREDFGTGGDPTVIKPPNFNETANNITLAEGEIIDGFEFDIDKTLNIQLLPGQSLSLQFFAGGRFGGAFSDGDLDMDFENIEGSVTVTENSFFPDSKAKATLFHDTGDSLTKIITGEPNTYYSEFYGRVDLGYTSDGCFSYTALTTGFWIRNFYERRMKISLEDFLETSNVIHNTGYGIEIIDGREVLVHEDLKYFFQQSIAIKLNNQVNNVVRKPAKDFYNSSVSFGYKKPTGDRLYEEAMGLDEYNVKTGFTLPLTRVDSTYEKESASRSDAYAKEFARRRPKSGFPEEDTRYDNDNHLLDLKKGLGSLLEERTWQDDFEQEPSGIYSPETATNLRLTPRQINKRHQWFYGAALQRLSDKDIIFSSSVGNSDLTLKEIGKPKENEKDNIRVSDLEKPIFYPQWIEFEHEVDFFVNQQVYGKTEIDGRWIPNYYFQVEFINENGNKEKGYLFELSPNNEGKWKILKSL